MNWLGNSVLDAIPVLLLAALFLKLSGLFDRGGD